MHTYTIFDAYDISADLVTDRIWLSSAGRRFSQRNRESYADLLLAGAWVSMRAMKLYAP
jgi:hypothetical protein